jgi:hypothetical protein
MHARKYRPIAAAAAALVILMAAGTAAVIRSDGTEQAAAGPSNVLAEPDGAEEKGEPGLAEHRSGVDRARS